MFQAFTSARLHSLLNFGRNTSIKVEDSSKKTSSLKARFKQRWEEVSELNRINNHDCKKLNILVSKICSEQNSNTKNLNSFLENTSYISALIEQTLSLRKQAYQLKIKLDQAKIVLEKIEHEFVVYELRDWEQTQFKEVENFKAEARKEHDERMDLITKQMMQEYSTKVNKSANYHQSSLNLPGGAQLPTLEIPEALNDGFYSDEQATPSESEYLPQTPKVNNLVAEEEDYSD